MICFFGLLPTGRTSFATFSTSAAFQHIAIIGPDARGQLLAVARLESIIRGPSSDQTKEEVIARRRVMVTLGIVAAEPGRAARPQDFEDAGPDLMTVSAKFVLN